MPHVQRDGSTPCQIEALPRRQRRNRTQYGAYRCAQRIFVEAR